MKPKSINSVLLLGGYGFIGQALAQALRHQQANVEVIGRQNLVDLPQALARCETVVHLASGTTPGSSAQYPELEDANIALTQRMVELMRPLPPRHLVYFSSGGTVYGNPTQLPVPETARLAPLSPYGCGKVVQEKICRTLSERGHAVTVLRPSNAYGPGQGVRAGFGLVRTLLEHARQGTVLQIWGDGESVRDYIYIDDLVDATLRLMMQPEMAGTYNLGSGMGHSVNQVKTLVKQMTNCTIATSYGPARGVDVRSVVLDGLHMQSAVQWKPQTNLVDGVRQTWESMRSVA